MIRTTDQGQKRRIAVIGIPRPQRARMGSLGVIRPGEPRPAVSWTTMSLEPPDTSANWIAYKLMEQARARETTPGSLNYTPASDHPAPNVAPWNSWLMPNCAPGSAPPPSSPAAPAGPAPTAATPMAVILPGVASSASYLSGVAPAGAGPSGLWLAIGLLGAAASVTYLVTTAKQRR